MKLSKWIKDLKGNKLVRHLKTWYNSVFDFNGQSSVPLLPGQTAGQSTSNTKVQSIEKKPIEAKTNSQRKEVEQVLQIILNEPVQKAALHVDKYNQYMHTNIKLTSLGLISKKKLQGLIYHFINQNRLEGNRQQNVKQLEQELHQVNSFNMSYFSYKKDSTIGQLTKADIKGALTKLKHILCGSQTYASAQK